MVVRSVPNIYYFKLPSFCCFSNHSSCFFLPFSFSFLISSFIYLFFLFQSLFYFALLLSFFFFPLFVFCYVFFSFRSLNLFLSSVILFSYFSFSPFFGIPPRFSPPPFCIPLRFSFCCSFQACTSPPPSSALSANTVAHLRPSLVFALPCCSPCVLLRPFSAFVCFTFIQFLSPMSCHSSLCRRCLYSEIPLIWTIRGERPPD